VKRFGGLKAEFEKALLYRGKGGYLTDLICSRSTWSIIYSYDSLAVGATPRHLRVRLVLKGILILVLICLILIVEYLNINI
jgi:hypothetical protein